MFSKCLEMKPDDNIDSQVNVALILNELKRFDDAIRCYKSILLQDGANTMALFNMGNAHLDLHNYEEALEAFEVQSFCSISALSILMCICSALLGSVAYQPETCGRFVQCRACLPASNELKVYKQHEPDPSVLH